MPEDALTVSLVPIADHADQYTLTYGGDTSSYPIAFAPAKSVTFTAWLRQWQSLLTRDTQSSSQLTPMALMREIGMRLWQALLPETAPTALREDLAKALRTGLSPLLFSLPAALAELPWELLCDPEPPEEEGFVARQRPLLRLVPEQTPTPPASVPLPLRVLVLISSPPSLGEDSRVDVESERAAVEEALRSAREAGQLHLHIEDIVTIQRVRDALVRFKPHILHYIGHGGYTEATGGVLLWEDEHGHATPISASQLATLLRPRRLAAVLLHACQTGRRNAHPELQGVATALIQAGIPAVVSQQANLSYASSQLASHAWYSALTAGESLATALFEVRQELSLTYQLDWAVPLLQATPASLLPLLHAQAEPASPDPALRPQGAAADLPAPAGVFVGRHRELRALRRLLEPGSQQVMALVTGPGGIGKSTLVAQAIIRYGSNYTAVLTLSCLGYQDMSLFLKRIADFLTLHANTGPLEKALADPHLSLDAKIEHTITAFNQAGPFVLVVDNLETAQHDDQTLRDVHLRYFLQKLLTNLRRGRVLITGRYAVKNLLPDGKFDTSLLRMSLDDLSWYETNQLLLRHPRLAHLGERVRQTLIEEFGGLPYVYDLLSSDAASQSLELLIRDVQGRITQERKKRSAAEWQELRQHLVEFAALAATVARLAEPARTLLARLSIFRQAFPLVALEQGLQVTRNEWQPLLDWSLLRYEPLEKNYHLHSITKRYAQDLLEAQDRHQTQHQLAAWYEAYADQESHDLTDYLEAHFFFRSAGDLDHAASLVSQLSTQLRRFGLYPLLKELHVRTLNDFRNVDQRQVASSLHQLGILAQDQGDYEQARRLYQQSLSINEQLGDLSGRATTLHALGTLAQDQGDYEQARRLYQQSLSIKEQLGNLSGRAATLHALGVLAQDQGDYEQARRLYQQSLSISEQLGNLSERADTLHQLGILAQDQGDYEQAHRLYQQSLSIKEQLGNLSGRASSLHALGVLAQRQGDYEQARRLYQQSLSIQEQLGDLSGRAATLHALGVLAQQQGDYEQARRLYQQSLSIKEQLGDLSGRATTLHALGILAQDQGDYEQAHRLYQQSLSIQEQLGNLSGRAATLHQLGSLAQRQGDYEQARRLYQQSLSIEEQLGNLSGRANTLHQLGILAQDQGDYEQARRLYQESLSIQEQLGDLSGRAATLHQLGILAQRQGDYEQARRLYQQSLSIQEQLGNLSGIANSLGQLGILVDEQGKSEEALIYMIQAYLLFERLHSPSQQIAQRMLTKLRAKVDEAVFTQRWHELARDRALPSFSGEQKSSQPPSLMQTLLAFIQASTWSESQQFLQTHPELLEPEIDHLLQELAALQEQQKAREIIEQHRHLLARCREQGIDAAFSQLGKEQPSETAFVEKLNRLCAEVVTALRDGDVQQREELARRVEQMRQTPVPMEGAEDFLRVLVAWLQGGDDQEAREKLQPPFVTAYQQMVAAVKPGDS